MTTPHNSKSGPTTTTHRPRGAGAPADMVGDLSEFGDLGRKAAEQASQALVARVRDEPYPMIAIAAGLGLLIGGGMWRLVARSVLGLGTRVALAAVASAVTSRITPNNNQQER